MINVNLKAMVITTILSTLLLLSGHPAYIFLAALAGSILVNRILSGIISGILGVLISSSFLLAYYYMIDSLALIQAITSIPDLLFIIIGIYVIQGMLGGAIGASVKKIISVRYYKK